MFCAKINGFEENYKKSLPKNWGFLGGLFVLYAPPRGGGVAPPAIYLWFGFRVFGFGYFKHS